MLSLRKIVGTKLRKKLLQSIFLVGARGIQGILVINFVVALHYMYSYLTVSNLNPHFSYYLQVRLSYFAEEKS